MRMKFSFAYLFLLMCSSLGILLFDVPAAAPERALNSPSFQNWFGTDILGRDLFFRVLEGTRISLGIGLAATMGSFILAIVVAFLAFRSPRWLDDLIMRMVEILIALPNIIVISLLILFLSNAFVEKSQLDKILILSTALVCTSWFSLARQIRSLLEGERSQTYVESARAIGASDARIYFFHLIPNLTTPLLVLLGLQIPNQLLFESFLSFVGFGIQPPTASWGVLIQEGWRTLSSYPHLILIPSLILFLTVLSLNVLFEEFRRVLRRR